MHDTLHCESVLQGTMDAKGKLKKTKIYNKENVFKKFVFLHFRTTYKHTEAVTRISNISVLT